jgi:8-hydroxy-5-deazaflavin:NADPH oxidoreductase
MSSENHSRRVFLSAALATSVLPALARAQGTAPVKIGVIGSGHIGGTIGTLWVKAGHPVLFSSRHPENLKSMVEGLGPNARAGTPAEAVGFGDVVFVAVPYRALPEIGHDLGPKLAGKIVLDACNAVAARDGDIADAAREKGIGLMTASLLPGARVVRAFNTMGYRVFESQAHRSGEPLAIPIAGDDQQAVQVAAQLVRDAGFEPVVVGKLATASEFAQGAKGYGQQVGARELRERLGLPQQ